MENAKKWKSMKVEGESEEIDPEMEQMIYEEELLRKHGVQEHPKAKAMLDAAHRICFNLHGEYHRRAVEETFAVLAETIKSDLVCAFYKPSDVMDGLADAAIAYVGEKLKQETWYSGDALKVAVYASIEPEDK